MTNGEKYLKVSVNEFFKAILESKIDISGLYSLEKWLLEEAKPTLTEDEKVILRNIDQNNFEKIGRCTFSLYLKTYSGEEQCYISYMYHHLFQFIKKRRRIYYKGVIK